MNLTVEVIDETINISVSVTEMKVPVYLVNEIGGNLEEISIANVTNDTAPEATDKLFLWRTVKGWFYIYYQKLISIFFAGGGFKANLYFTARASEVADYKLLSYQNDVEPTTLTASLNSSYQLLRTYIFNLPYGDTTIPEGLWKSILYGRVSSAVGDTTLRLDGFMRTGVGVETQIFSVESSSIKNTTLDDIPNEQWLPQLTVDPDSYFGVKLYGKTTKGGGVTLTTVVGGANASYLITPAAVEHNLARRRDVADCHPAKAITFDVDPVPDFTAVAKGNTLEAITHKVAGLQEKEIINIEIPEDTYSITVDEDKHGNPLSIPEGESIIIRIYVKRWNISDDRIAIILNEITDNVYNTTSVDLLSRFFTAGTNYSYQNTSVILSLVDGEVGGLIYTKIPGNQSVYAINTVGLDATSINSITLFPYGSTASRIGEAKLIISRL